MTSGRPRLMMNTQTPRTATGAPMREERRAWVIV
jgi:hypothetical protein